MLVEVLSNLYLGDKNSFNDLERLQRLGVKLVVSLSGGNLSLPEDVQQITIHIRDNNQDSILSVIDDVVHRMDQYLASGRGVLVHCMAAMSRSPSVVMAYLMRYQGLNVEEALHKVTIIILFSFPV